MKVCKPFIETTRAALCLGSLAESQHVLRSVSRPEEPSLNYCGGKCRPSSISPASRDLAHWPARPDVIARRYPRPPGPYKGSLELSNPW
jgi:hypothetical protein